MQPTLISGGRLPAKRIESKLSINEIKTKYMVALNTPQSQILTYDLMKIKYTSITINTSVYTAKLLLF